MTPFQVGQTLPDVLRVTKRTGRTLREIEFGSADGGKVTIPVDRKTDIQQKLAIMGVDTKQVFWYIRRVYNDCELEFRFIDGHYRVTEVR